jgi:transcriptional regulator with XRE-family HTH domain
MKKTSGKRTMKKAIGYGYRSDFPKRLRKLLDGTGTTQDRLAESVGVTRQSVAQWKDGITKPDVYYLRKIAEFFDVSCDYLIGMTDVRSLETELQAVAKFTWLSEGALGNIVAEKGEHPERIDMLNAILESGDCLRQALDSFLRYERVYYELYMHRIESDMGGAAGSEAPQEISDCELALMEKTSVQGYYAGKAMERLAEAVLLALEEGIADDIGVLEP